MPLLPYMIQGNRNGVFNMNQEIYIHAHNPAMIEATLIEGRTISINPAMVVSVDPCRCLQDGVVADCLEIQLVGRCFKIRESMKYVVAAMQRTKADVTP